jgi:transcriptional regulator with XRE-family HTH domain
VTEIRQIIKPHRGRMFREMRHRSGLSLQALGAAVAVDPSTISRWETRKEFVQFMRFVQALHRLGTTPELFLGLRAPENAMDPISEFPQFATPQTSPLDQFRIAR